MDWILLGLAVMPVFVLLIFIYTKDKYNKEPLGMLVKALLAGMFCTLPAMLMESWVGGYAPDASFPIANGLFNGFAVAGFCEELSKLVLLALVVWRSPHFDEYFDGIVYAAFVSLGFAGVENVLYVFGQSDFSQAVTTGSVRALLSVPAHFLFSLVMGYYFALAKFLPKQRFGNLLKALLFPLVLHGTFDSLLMIPDNFGEEAGILAFGMFAVFIWFDIKLWKIGKRRLRHLQELSGEQNEADFDANDGSGATSQGSGNAFDGIDWNV